MFGEGDGQPYPDDGLNTGICELRSVIECTEEVSGIGDSDGFELVL